MKTKLDIAHEQTLQDILDIQQIILPSNDRILNETEYGEYHGVVDKLNRILTDNDYSQKYRNTWNILQELRSSAYVSMMIYHQDKIKRERVQH